MRTPVSSVRPHPGQRMCRKMCQRARARAPWIPRLKGAGVIGLALALSSAAWAACKMTTPPTANAATATLTAAGAQTQRVRAPTISGHFAFSCDSPTPYRLLFQDSTATTPGSATFRTASGAELQGQLRLRQVCGQKVDTEVARLPLAGYSGMAAAGQTCASTFDVVFAEATVLPRHALGSTGFNAALQVIIEY